MTTFERERLKALERESTRVTPSSNEILRKTPAYLPSGVRLAGNPAPLQTMKAFIDEYRVTWVKPICKVLPIAPLIYYEHAVRRTNPALQPARTRRDGTLREQILRIWDENFQVYGVRSCGARGTL